MGSTLGKRDLYNQLYLFDTVLPGYCDKSVILTVLEKISRVKNCFYYCEIIGYCKIRLV